jgi:hypothetical protein
VDRESFARVFYGEGPVPPPWATDCPVKFEVWLRYAQEPRGEPVNWPNESAALTGPR